MASRAATASVAGSSNGFGGTPAPPGLPRRPRVLVAVTGSVAGVKTATLADILLAAGAEVHVAATSSATHFLSAAGGLPPDCGPVLDDKGEWRQWGRVGDPVLHIELRRWADVVVVAPLSANTLAKAALGLCDNLVTCVLRAWDFRKPCLIAPAMNTVMWDSPFTARHLAACRELGMRVVDPIPKRLACGDVGMGAMAEPVDIASAVLAALEEGPLLGEGSWVEVGESLDVDGTALGAAEQNPPLSQ